MGPRISSDSCTLNPRLLPQGRGAAARTTAQADRLCHRFRLRASIGMTRLDRAGHHDRGNGDRHGKAPASNYQPRSRGSKGEHPSRGPLVATGTRENRGTVARAREHLSTRTLAPAGARENRGAVPRAREREPATHSPPEISRAARARPAADRPRQAASSTRASLARLTSSPRIHARQTFLREPPSSFSLFRSFSSSQQSEHRRFGRVPV